MVGHFLHGNKGEGRRRPAHHASHHHHSSLHRSLRLSSSSHHHSVPAAAASAAVTHATAAAAATATNPERTRATTAATIAAIMPSSASSAAAASPSPPSSSSSSSYSILDNPYPLTAETVAALPPPGLSGPTSLIFSPFTVSDKNNNIDDAGHFDTPQEEPLHLAFVSALPHHHHHQQQRSRRHGVAATTPSSSYPGERQLCVLECDTTTGFATTTTTSTSSRPRDTLQPLLKFVPHSSNNKSPVLPHHTHNNNNNNADSLEERLRRERQRLQASGGTVTQFSWTRIVQSTNTKKKKNNTVLRILVPLRGNVYVQDRVGDEAQALRLIYDKHDVMMMHQQQHSHQHQDLSAIDPQLSPDGTMVAFVVAGDLYVTPVPEEEAEESHSGTTATPPPPLPIQITFGAQPQQHRPPPPPSSSLASTNTTTSTSTTCLTHGLADFVAQEEMDRYRGYWWHPDSNGILFARVDESHVPPYRIAHQAKEPHHPHQPHHSQQQQQDSDAHININDGGASYYYEDHRYPFAGQANPKVQLGFLELDVDSIRSTTLEEEPDEMQVDLHHDGNMILTTTTTSTSHFSMAQDVARDYWESSTNNLHNNNNNNKLRWLDPPPQATEYLARVEFLPDGSACAQWQNRTQSVLVLCRMDVVTRQTCTLLVEQCGVAAVNDNSNCSDGNANPTTATTSHHASSSEWINLHHMFRVLPRAVHPNECKRDGGVSDIDHGVELPLPLPEGSFSFLFASERTGYSHLYLYTHVPGFNSEQALLVRAVSEGEWMVESIVEVDMEKDVVYVTGTYDSPLERHLYALPLCNHHHHHAEEEETSSSLEMTQEASMAVESAAANTLAGANGPMNAGTEQRGGMRRGFKSVMNALSGAARQRSYHVKSAMSTSNMSIIEDASGDDRVAPLRLTVEPGMHTIHMDEQCRVFVDSSSDLDRPTQVKVYRIRDTGGPLVAAQTIAAQGGPPVELLFTLYDASGQDHSALLPSMDTPERLQSLPPPELLSYPTSDGTATLHAALYRPDARIHGPGPYPLVCAVYGGPHVQRVNRSWSQCADMRAQRLRSLGFAVVKCDNRGSSRRGVAFESCIRGRLGRLEVLDQVTTVRHLTMRGVADAARVGIYGWSYGGYLSAMCLCRAPDVFHVAVAGAPVTSWDGYDTHYTERYMGLPSENPSGYRESAVLDHVPNMRGHLMIVHGLIDENVHFRHTARLINRLIAAGKDYDLLIFPDERHSPRRLRDRIYMEQRISDYFLRHLGTLDAEGVPATARGGAAATTAQNVRTMAGHL